MSQAQINRKQTQAEATPEAISKGGLFYGWRIVGLTLLTQALQAGLLIYAFGTMAVSIENEFGVSRAEVMLAATILSLSANLLSPILGRQVDQRSVRSLMLLAISALSLGLIGLSFTRSIWQVWVVFGTLLPIGNLLLGQLTSSALITRWFADMRGRAMGFSAVGTSLGGFTLPVLLTLLIEWYDWRIALAAIGIGAFIITAPLIRWLVVDQPSDIGLFADGKPAPETPGTPTAADEPAAMRPVIRERAFWCQTVAIGIGLFVYIGFLSNLYPHALSLNVAPAAAASLMSLVAVCSVIGKLGFGILADRIELRVTLWSAFTLMIAGAWILGMVRDNTGLTLGAILFGLAAGGLLPVWGAMVARSFGQARFGRALGAMNLAMAPITLMSAPYAGYIFDRFDSYQYAFLSYCGFLVVAALSLAPLRFPGGGKGDAS